MYVNYEIEYDTISGWTHYVTLENIDIVLEDAARLNEFYRNVRISKTETYDFEEFSELIKDGKL